MRSFWRSLSVLLLLFRGLAGVAHAQTFPPLTGRIVDAAGLLSPEQVAQLTAQSDAIEKATTRQFVVATIPDLQGYPIEDYGFRLGRAWGIGQKDAKNGIILIIAPKERRVRIEVGYGLEPIMTDALSGMIVNNTILPKFKAGDMPGGIMAGAAAIAEQMKLPLEAAEARGADAVRKAQQQATRRQNNGGGGVPVFVILVILFFVLPMFFRRAGGARYQSSGLGSAVGNVVLWSALNSLSDRGGGGGWGGGDSGGGGFSGGGGSFGGGGASGEW